MIENTLKNWSYKKYKMYQSCPYSVKLKYIDRAPEPEIDPKKDENRQRGIRLHEELALAVSDNGPIPREAANFEEIIENLRARERVLVEQDHFFNRRWEPQPTWDNHWLQVKQDIVVVEDEYVLTGDWKSGKKYGNEVDHFKQMQLYSVAAWLRYPGRPLYISELYYIDKDDIWTVEFKPADMEKAIGMFDAEVAKMFADTLFRPRPSIVACRYCPFGPKNGTGLCPVGVS